MSSLARYLRIVGLVVATSTMLASALGIGAAWAQETVVALGDSNTSGAGIGRAVAFPAQLEAMLDAQGYNVRVINAGVPGDTFEGMLARLDRSVPPGTNLVIVQGGYNDVAVHTPPLVITASIDRILARLDARHIKAILCGFFYSDWDAVGRALSRRHHAIFVSGSTCYDPGHRGLDGLHMTAIGHEVVAARLAPVVEQALYPLMVMTLRGRRHRTE